MWLTQLVWSWPNLQINSYVCPVVSMIITVSWMRLLPRSLRSAGSGDGFLKVRGTVFHIYWSCSLCKHHIGVSVWFCKWRIISLFIKYTVILYWNISSIWVRVRGFFDGGFKMLLIFFICSLDSFSCIYGLHLCFGDRFCVNRLLILYTLI